jgi:hypothetical protein
VSLPAPEKRSSFQLPVYRSPLAQTNSPCNTHARTPPLDLESQHSRVRWCGSACAAVPYLPLLLAVDPLADVAGAADVSQRALPVCERERMDNRKCTRWVVALVEAMRVRCMSLAHVPS